VTGGFRLTIVGCSGSYSGPDGPASCYLLEAEANGRTWRIVLDLGSGALGALHRYADPLAIDAVLLSHLHPDHCIDMTGYHVLRRYHPSGPQPRIPVYGPEGTAARLARGYDLPEDPGLTGEFDFRTYGGPLEIGPFSIMPIEVVHPVTAFGLRVGAGGSTLAYTGDTGPCPQLDDLARDADVLLSEASFLDAEAATNPPDLHLTGGDAAELARRAGARRLLLTHIPAWYDSADVLADAMKVAGYDGAIALATPGAVHTV